MKRLPKDSRVFTGFLLTIVFAGMSLLPVLAQWPFGPPPTTPAAQRNALGAVRAQVNWVDNATRTAQNSGNVWQAFQGLRQAYADFRVTIAPNQLAAGANQLAELDAGLDIIQEAFANYEDDLAARRPAGPALRNMCRVVREGSALWFQELNKTCARLRIGWGA